MLQHFLVDLKLYSCKLLCLYVQNAFKFYLEALYHPYDQQCRVGLVFRLDLPKNLVVVFSFYLINLDLPSGPCKPDGPGNPWNDFMAID